MKRHLRASAALATLAPAPYTRLLRLQFDLGDPLLLAVLESATAGHPDEQAEGDAVMVIDGERIVVTSPRPP